MSSAKHVPAKQPHHQGVWMGTSQRRFYSPRPPGGTYTVRHSHPAGECTRAEFKRIADSADVLPVRDRSHSPHMSPLARVGA